MKNVLTLFMVLFTIVANSQTVYTNSGKLVTKLKSEDISKLKFKLKIKPSYLKYERILVTLCLYPKGAKNIDKWGKAYYFETKDLKANEYIYGLLWNAEKETSDYVSTNAPFKIYNLLDPTYTERSDQFYVYDVYVRGQDIAEYKYETNIHNVTTKTPVYRGPRLDWFEAGCEVDFGKVSDTYAIDGGYFTLPKVDAKDLANFKTYSSRDEGQLLEYKVNKEDRDNSNFYYYDDFELKAIGYPKSEMTIDSLKEEINLFLIEGSSYPAQSNVRKSQVDLFSRNIYSIYYPFYNLAEKRTTDEPEKKEEVVVEEEKKGKAKFKKAFGDIKKAYTGGSGGFSAGKSSHDKYREYVPTHINDLKWEDATWGNIKGQAISIDVYHHSQRRTEKTQTSGKYELKEGEQGKTRKLDVFVFEIEGKVFFISMIKSGKNRIDTELDKAFVKNMKTNITKK